MRTLARRMGGWSGFDVTTVRPLAMQLAVEWIAAEGVRVVDAFEEEARFDDALDAALREAASLSRFAELSEGSGFRRGVRESLKALRLNGVAPDHLDQADFEDSHKRTLLASVLRHYERRLDADGRTDIAGVLERAARTLDRGTPLPAQRVLLVPGLGLRGHAGRLVRALEAHGAARLTTDPVVGLAVPPGMLHAEPPRPAREVEPPTAGAASVAPSHASPSIVAGLPLFEQVPSPPTRPAPGTRIDLFRAAGVHEELREVLRRVVASGCRFDEVEIVTPDPLLYGPTLQTLCARLGVDATFAVGLPASRTRPGRALTAWLRWLADDGPAPILRRLLQNADLVAPGRRPVDSPFLARALRALGIGWGRHRYRPIIAAAIERLQRDDASRRRRESVEQASARRDREAGNLRSLDRLLGDLLADAPDPRAPTSAARVAANLLTFLHHVPADSEVDRSAHERLARRLDRIAHTLTRTTSYSTAVATVREHIDIRVPAPRVEGKAPWMSDGGALHLSDLEHGGLSGRPLLFVVGMDAGRFPGGDRQDPFLLDRERRSLSSDLPVTEDRVHEQQFRLASLLARSRGAVTVSYPAWDAASARTLQPSAVLLALFRRREGNDALGYAELEAALGPPASRIPRTSAAIDDDDVWLSALADGDRLHDGRWALRRRHPALDAGLQAVERADDIEASPHVGILSADAERAARLDPRHPAGPRLSASALETLGTCPLRYFYARVLRVAPPDEPEFDLERWLPAAERGSLLHDVFQRAIERARRSGFAIGRPEFRDSTMQVLHDEIDRMRGELPPPSEAVAQAEIRVLEDDVRSFCAYLADDGMTVDRVEATEFDIGGEEPVQLRLPDGEVIRVRGRVDRIDRLDDGLRVVDYKTGRAWGHGGDAGIYNGGRRLQHVLYARAVERELANAPSVERVEYHFPTVKGENDRYAYTADQLSDGGKLIAELVKLPAAARFPATDDPSDCRFCDYRPVCRVGSVRDADDNESARRVEWSRARMVEGHPDLLTLRAIRSHEGTSS